MKRGFRDEFKYFKRKDVPPDLSKVVKFGVNKISENLQRCNVTPVRCRGSSTDWLRNFGMKDSSKWEVYSFLSKPGLLLIKNPFHASGQRYWIMRCLKYYTKKPNKLNIDAHNILESDEDWWEFCQRGNKEAEAALDKLRWATFGYHHNWDTKEYSETSKSDFPPDLKTLCAFIATELKFSEFNAEAAIINMYHFGSSLSGHTDHSEVNVTAPLFSFSFGQSAIFLIGGKTVGDEALPLLLESGDIIVMSGESRLCYHGVPKILPTDNQPWNSSEQEQVEQFNSEFFFKEVTEKIWDNKTWEPFECYVKKSRINMNVRQVLLPGQKVLGS